MAGKTVLCPSCGEQTDVPAIDVTTQTKPADHARREPAGPEEEDDFQLRSFKSEFDNLDLTPMADVTFLLLIFFIITASFDLQKTLEIPPPNPDEQGAQQSMTLEEYEDNSVIVQIDERNVISVDYDPLPDPSQLVNALRDKKILERKNEILIDAHVNTLWETVVTVIDAANEIGMEKIRLASKSSAGS